MADFECSGSRGYEATGPIGAIAGAVWDRGLGCSDGGGAVKDRSNVARGHLRNSLKHVPIACRVRIRCLPAAIVAPDWWGRRTGARPRV